MGLKPARGSLPPFVINKVSTITQLVNIIFPYHRLISISMDEN